MRTRASVVAFVAGAMVLGMLVAAPIIRAEDKAAAGAYKIAVVNRSLALKDYNKQKAETTRLEAEYKKLQDPVDALSNAIEKDKKYYDENKEKMSPDDRRKFEDKVQAKYREYQTELAKGQGTIDTMRQRSMESLVKDYREAVKQVGLSGGYHLVFEADPSESTHAVLYASEAMDVTKEVTDYLNTHASAAPAAAPSASKAKASEGGAAKKSKAAK